MARVYNPEPKPNTSGDGQFWGVLVWKEVYCKDLTPFNYVFYIVGECISCAAETHLATDLTFADI